MRKLFIIKGRRFMLFHLIIYSCLTLFFCVPTVAQSATEEISNVRKVVSDERKAWGDLDVEKVVSYYTDDIYWINAFGIEKNGKPEVKTFLTKLFALPGFRAAKALTHDSILGVRMLSSKIAWSHEYSESSGQLTNTGQVMANRKTHIFYILLKEKNNWKISTFQVMDEKERLP